MRKISTLVLTASRSKIAFLSSSNKYVDLLVSEDLCTGRYKGSAYVKIDDLLSGRITVTREATGFLLSYKTKDFLDVYASVDTAGDFTVGAAVIYPVGIFSFYGKAEASTGPFGNGYSAEAGVKVALPRNAELSAGAKTERSNLPNQGGNTTNSFNFNLEKKFGTK
jgi:hypothetical protein